MDISPTKRNITIAVFIVSLLVIANWYIFSQPQKPKKVIQTLKVPSSNESGSTTEFSQPQIPTQPQTDDKGNIKFHDKGYDLFYPKDWEVEYADTFNMVHFYTKGDKTSVTIYERTSPLQYYPPADAQKNKIFYTVNGQVYDTTEYILGDKSAYIILDLPDAKQHSILIGSDYPAKARGSLSDYYQQKPTIYRILESLKFY